MAKIGRRVTMSSEFGNDFFTVTDDEGNEFELELIDSVEFSGKQYMAFLPTDVDEDDEDYGMVILKVETEDGEEYLMTVDDEDELESVFEVFAQRLSDDDEE